VSDCPPSLQSTPARIREYLRTHEVVCRKCGYPLLGLPEPKCPECGTWTDVSRRVRTHNLRLITKHLESLGTVDDYLVRHSPREVLWACRFDDVEALRIVNRWRARDRRWMIILGNLFLAEAFAFFIILIGYPAPTGALGLVVFLLAGLCLLILAVGLQPQQWVVARTAERSYEVPLYLSDEAEARKAVDRLLKVMEERCSRPPTPNLDDAAAEVKEGRCRRCGYDLKGPPLMVAAPDAGAQVAGFLAIVFSFSLLVCSGAARLEHLSRPAELMPCAAIAFIGVGIFIFGLWLMRRKLEGPAVPEWTGPPQCPACGWEPGGDS